MKLNIFEETASNIPTIKVGMLVEVTAVYKSLWNKSDFQIKTFEKSLLWKITCDVNITAGLKQKFLELEFCKNDTYHPRIATVLQCRVTDPKLLGDSQIPLAKSGYLLQHHKVFHFWELLNAKYEKQD